MGTNKIQKGIIVMAAYRWKNKSGTGNRSCKCGSWKQHWINYSRKGWPDVCSVVGCNNAATLGAHVFCTDRNVSGEFIIPACDSCNKSNREFNLKDDVTLAPANKQETCER